MNTSLSWIKMYVPDLDVTAQEYTDAMTLDREQKWKALKNWTQIWIRS